VNKFEKAARLARLLVVGCLIVGIVPTAALAAKPNLPVMSIASSSVTEGNSGTTAMQFNVSLSRAATGTVTVRYSTATGTAVAPSDYSTASGGLSFAPGETSKTITVQVNGDALFESNETFTVGLRRAKGARLQGGAATGTINNDDAAPALSVSDITSPIAEGDAGTTNGTFTVSLGSTSTSTITVDYMTQDGSAQASSDYVSTNGSLTFAPGQSAKSVQVQVNGDLLDEDDEDFKLHIQNAVGATIAKADGVATVADNDVTPNLSVNDSVVTELGSGNATTAIFTVTLSNPSAKNVTVDYATADGTAHVADGDYNAANGTLTFLPGGALTQQIPVTVNGDDTAEDPNETFTLALTNPVRANLAADPMVGTATINDDDPNPRVSINDVAVNEGDDTNQATFTLTLSNTSGSDITVNMETVDNTALAGSDYTAKTQAVVIPAGQQTATFVVNVTGDDRDENSQSFYANIASLSGGGAQLADPVESWGIGTILDDDDAPTVSVSDVSVREGDKDTKPAAFTLTLSGPSEKPITIDIDTADGSAKFNGADYFETHGTVPFPAGETTYTGNFSTVPVKGDRKMEANEAFFVNLSAPSNVTVSDGHAKGRIMNNDVTVSLRIKKFATKVRAKGFVRPPHAGIKMVVRYYKKRANGKWALLRTKRPALSVAKDFNHDGKKESKYGAAFGRRTGRCKIVAKFPGDATHRAGQAKKVFSC
jgi:large repetitive protein